MKIAITGGGTGGHLEVARALNEAFVSLGADTIYIGSTQGEDRRWFEKDESFETKYFLPSSGVVDKKGWKKFQAFGQILASTRKAKNYLHDCNAVLSVGGYSAAPASFAAILGKIPLFIHEQNAHTGRLNSILKPFSKGFFCSFLPPYPPYPVDEEYFKTRRVRETLQTIIFLGGSQGAKQINDLALDLAKDLHANNIRIIHQTGRRDFTRIKQFYQNEKIPADVFDFSLDLPKKVAEADLAISRSGAGTLWGLATNLLPALYLPYPYAAGDHQRKNALFLAKKDASLLYENHTIYDILNLDIHYMSRNLQDFSIPNGALVIATEILEKL